MSAGKVYLGDGVYVQFNGYHVELTTENGVETTNRILLEPEVLEQLESYVKGLRSGAAGGES